MTGASPASDDRVLILALTAKDAATTEVLLSQAGIPHGICLQFDALVDELHAGAAAILVPEEVVKSRRCEALRAVLGAQPPWSDLPVLILTQPGADSEESRVAVHTLGNVTLLERPVRVATLVSALRTAMRARARQYEIREHLAERARTEQALRETDRRKDEFLATLGHELRNPLAPLLTGLQLLKVAQIPDPAVTKIVTVMQRQVAHLVRLVDDLLEVSRITRGLVEVRREPLDLASVLRAAVDTSRPVVESGRHELTVDLPAEPLMVSGDPVRLTQVFANLLTNAAKYTDPGGHIALSLGLRDGRAVVAVRDDGIGIPPEQLDSIFDMFTQVDRSTRRAQGGPGIGLTLVRSLVKMHGGRVNAHSAGLGGGSEFVVELPVLAGARAEPLTGERPGNLPALRFLVVDDNADAADMVGTLLTVLGANVLTVHSDREALDVVHVFRPHAVLLDIGMPEIDGYEVARQLRQMPDHADVVLIALTGWGQEHDLQRSRAAGFDHHLVKPLDFDQLRAILAKDAARRFGRRVPDAPLRRQA